MGDEQQRALHAAEPLIVEGRQDCFARARRGDDEVSVAAMHLALRVECVEHLRLIGIRAHLQTR